MKTFFKGKKVYVHFKNSKPHITAGSMAKSTYLCLELSGKKKEIQLAELTKTDTADPPYMQISYLQFTYLLKFICIPQTNTCRTFIVIR